jgi:N-acetyl sugar amidotransferase
VDIVTRDEQRAGPAASKRAYQACVRCVMDTSDAEIVFDPSGVCGHCRRADLLLKTRLPEYRTGAYQIERIVARIKEAGKHSRYDCIVGVSGGADSTYAAYLAKRLGLRPLAVHFDNGWNSELAVQNIENTLRTMGIELFTHVVDWPEFRDLQLSFLKASVPDAEIPTDHAIWALLYQAAAKFGTRYILSGTNLSTESILPKSWTYGITDWHYIQSVHRRFGSRPLRSFPHASLTQFAWYVLVRRIKTVSILNSVPYDKATVAAELEREIGWRDYGGKHHESVYTRFFQSYMLPRKFGIDKRRAHFSSLIVSGQMSRAEALTRLDQPIAAGPAIQQDLEFVAKKFELSVGDFEALMAAQPRTYRHYPNADQFHERLKRLLRLTQRWGLLPRQVGM